jgi:hypothetical protein
MEPAKGLEPLTSGLRKWWTAVRVRSFLSLVVILPGNLFVFSRRSLQLFPLVKGI